MSRTVTLEAVRACLSANGLSDVGAIPFAAVSDRLLSCRAAARLSGISEPHTVLAAVFPYRFAEDGRPRNLCRYACVTDYHAAAGAVLERAAADLRKVFSPCRFEAFIDNSPFPEVYTAALAGLGVVGDNRLLIHPRYGSWVFIGTIATDLKLSPMPAPCCPPPECRHCGACAAACPSGCLADNDMSGCLSAVSQRKGDLTAAEQDLLRRGGLVWGCDRCQEVCPMNASAVIAPHPCFSAVGYRPWLDGQMLQEEDLLADRAYLWRGSSVLRRNLNVLYAGDDGQKSPD